MNARISLISLVLFCLGRWISMLFWDKDVILYASACVSIDVSVEYAFNKVKT